MSWKDGAMSDRNIDNLLMLQAEAREKARIIRNCERCSASWRDTPEGDVERCTCYREWKSAVITLRTALKDAKEDRDEWESDDVFNFHTARDSSDGRAGDERAREVLEQAASEGNVVAAEMLRGE